MLSTYYKLIITSSSQNSHRSSSHNLKLVKMSDDASMALINLKLRLLILLDGDGSKNDSSESMYFVCRMKTIVNYMTQVTYQDERIVWPAQVVILSAHQTKNTVKSINCQKNAFTFKL